MCQGVREVLYIEQERERERESGGGGGGGGEGEGDAYSCIDLKVRHVMYCILVCSFAAIKRTTWKQVLRENRMAKANRKMIPKLYV